MSGSVEILAAPAAAAPAAATLDGVLSAYPWRETEPPKDRGIWVRSNVICQDEFSTWVDPYEGYACWSVETQDWLDRRGLSIRANFEAEFRALAWIELAERAANCPENETDSSANIYFWDNAQRRTLGDAGFFAYLRVWHSATGHDLVRGEEGPFATRALAVAALAGLLAAPLPVAVPLPPPALSALSPEEAGLLTVCKRLVTQWDSDQNVYVGCVEDAGAAIEKLERESDGGVRPLLRPEAAALLAVCLTLVSQWDADNEGVCVEDARAAIANVEGAR